MKNTKTITLFLSVVMAFCMFSYNASANESQNVSCIGISAPYKYSDYNNVSFAVSFDGNITDANYKHIACSPAVLKTMSYWDNPAMTDAVIDYLYSSGVIDSMNDCIEVNGKKVREWQKTGQLSLMILVGELGENAQMNIDFNGAIDEVRIDNLNQEFEITLYKGLIFPNGARLKDTQIWKYSPVSGSFTEKTGSKDGSDADFSAYYNGKQLKNDCNTAQIYNGEFSLNNICVYPDNPDSAVKVEPQFEKLAFGLNYVYITVTAPDGINSKSIQLALDNTFVKPATRKEQTVRALKIAVAVMLLLFCIVMAVLTAVKRRRRK